jgi:hypothetical protein
MAYRLEWRRRGDVNEIELDRRGDALSAPAIDGVLEAERGSW